MTVGAELNENLRSQGDVSLHGSGKALRQTTLLKIALLTGGIDKPYVLGLVDALTTVGTLVEIIGSNELNVPELRRNPRVRFLNLRGDQNPNASLPEKALRVSRYYLKLIKYAATAKPFCSTIKAWERKLRLPRTT